MEDKHDPFWLDLAYPFRLKFGWGYMQMRAIIHHLYDVIHSSTKALDIEMLVKQTGYSENRVAEVIQWLNEQQVFDFEINWQ